MLARLGCFVVVVLTFAGSSRGDEPLPMLFARLADADPAVRVATVKQLAAIRPTTKPIVEALRNVAALDTAPDVRKEADAAAAVLGVIHAEEMVERLRKALKSPKIAVRVEAASEAARMGKDAEPLKGLLAELMLEPAEKVRQLASDSLLKVDQPFHAAVTSLVLDDVTAVYPRITGIDYFQKREAEAKAALPVIKAFYARSVKAVPSYRTEWYSTDPQSKALQLLVLAAPDDPNVVRDVLGLTGNFPSIGREVGISLINDIKATPEIKIAALNRALNSAKHRAAAVTALGKMGPAAKSTLPTLIKLKLDSDKEVRDAAQIAVEAVQGK